MSPKRGDRVAPPPITPEWELRFLTAEAVKGWDELCRQAPGNARKAFEISGRIWYLAGPEARIAWFEYCGTGHPNATDRTR